MRRFYERLLSQEDPGREVLREPVTASFQKLLAAAVSGRVERTALDLGYGVGHYTVALAEAGFAVTAVDQVPGRLLAARLPRALHDRVTILEAGLEDYVPAGRYGVAVAKDVLHYLNRATVERLLRTLTSSAHASHGHYLRVFTDVVRRTQSGERVVLAGEADYSTAEFCGLVREVYASWDVQIEVDDHEEVAGGGSYDFRARKVDIVALKNLS